MKSSQFGFREQDVNNIDGIIDAISELVSFSSADSQFTPSTLCCVGQFLSVSAEVRRCIITLFYELEFFCYPVTCL